MKKLLGLFLLLVLLALGAAGIYATMEGTADSPVAATTKASSSAENITVEAVGDVPDGTMEDVRQAVSLFSDDMSKNGAPLRHAVHV